MSLTEVDVRQLYVMPGECQVSAEPVRLLTILGSCVAVCLYDPVRGVGGLNHFLLPGDAPASEPESLRWGKQAMDALFRQVLSLGARERFLEAKLFGGAQIGQQSVSHQFRIGDRNVEFARAELARCGVVIKSESVGGNRGRKIIMETWTGIVWVKELASGVG